MEPMGRHHNSPAAQRKQNTPHDHISPKAYETYTLKCQLMQHYILKQPHTNPYRRPFRNPLEEPGLSPNPTAKKLQNPSALLPNPSWPNAAIPEP